MAHRTPASDVARIAQAGRCRLEGEAFFGAQSETIRERRYIFYLHAEALIALIWPILPPAFQRVLLKTN